MKSFLIFLLCFLTVSSAITENMKKVYKYLIDHGYTKEGAAGLIGNLKAESGVRPDILEKSKQSKLGMNSEEYIRRVNDGSYTNFVHDKAGFGLAQWTYYSRKQGLYNTCKKNSPHNIGDLHCQANYVVTELRTENGKLYNALTKDGDLYTLTSRVCKEYERPAVNNVDTRYSYAKKWYDRYK